jgi:hypothetical protein
MSAGAFKPREKAPGVDLAHSVATAWLILAKLIRPESSWLITPEQLLDTKRQVSQLTPEARRSWAEALREAGRLLETQPLE